MSLDAVGRLLLGEAGSPAGPILVVDDPGAALTHTLLDSVDAPLVLNYSDDVRDAQAAPAASRISGLDDGRIATVKTVLLRLPHSLAGLEETAQRLARVLPADAVLIAAGRVKHMTRTQNAVLAASFTEVRASLGQQKCRALHASGPRPGPVTWPRERALPEWGLTLVAHGATFNTNRLDAGTRLLLSALESRLVELVETTPPPAERVEAPRALDLGCGSGVLACWLAKRGWSVEASDVSAAAVASTRASAERIDVDVDVIWRDGLTGVAASSYDLIVTNPPFHVGAAKDSTPTLRMIEDAAEALRPGGQFWCVFNSHLPYLAAMRAAIGPTRVVARDRAYTVARCARG